MVKVLPVPGYLKYGQIFFRKDRRNVSNDSSVG